MSTRKSTLASPTAQGTKVENASTSSTTKSLEKTNACSPTADRPEMGANASSNTNIVNTSDSKATEQIQKTNQDTKPFLQRVTRNSPLLLASPHVGGITIKKEPLDPNEHHTNSESEEVGGTNSTTNTKKTNIRGRKSLKEHKELAEKEEDLEAKEKVKDKEDIVKETKEEQTEKKELKEQIEQKDTSTSTVQPATTTASNRLTRKSVANQEAANTRVTRQRQSSGASARSETPPARSRSGRCIGRGKMPVPMIDPTPAVTKRKRSVDVDNTTSNNKSTIDEPGPKYIKIEVKDPDIDNEEVLLSSQNTSASSESTDEPAIKIKQELVDESENEMPATTESTASTANTTSASTAVTTNAGRGKGNRGGPRKLTTITSTTSTTNNSPSTRATRQTKQTSPVQSNSTSTETKRRRMGSQTRSLLKTNVGSNSKNQPANGEDEDSKDSDASSTNTDDIVLALIKSEKISMEMDDDNTNDAKEQPAAVEKEEGIKTVVVAAEESNDLPPLVIDTDVAPSTSGENVETVESAAALTPVAASCSSVASGSEKAASLSPSELLSEGVSEISVKQFYKKPKFLENNLGIEEDPKLGNIVQKVAGLEPTTAVTATTPALTISTAPAVTATKTTTTTMSDERILDDSNSNESLNEGTLRFEDSIEEKKSASQDDCNSLSSGGNITPLLIVEDDDDEELEEVIEIKENVAQMSEASQIEKSLQNTATKHETLSDIVEKENLKLNIIEVDEEEETERDQDQEDELTLEESETISMDNNASINDEVITEIEDTANEENITEIEDFTDVTEVIQKPSKPDATVAPSVQDKNKSSLNESCDIVEDDEFTKLELITNDKENSSPANIVISLDVSTLTTTAEDEDNDVLAKIDAELKKIDERSKEKLITKGEDKLEVPFVLNSAEERVKDSIVELLVSHENMDIDGDVKLSDEDEAKINTKDEAIIDDVLDIKLDDEQPLIIAEDIKLLDVKDKQCDDEEVGIGSDMDSLLKDEKTEIKDNLVKTSSSDTEVEALNGKPTPTSSLGSSPIKLGLVLIKDDDSTSMKSGQSATSWITLDLENDDEETLRKKELHLQNLGLVTHKAAEKRRLEVIQSSAANVEASKAATQHQQQNKRNGKNSSHAASTHHEYTGTLKTIIKINRNSTGGSTSGGSNGRKTQSNAAGSSTSKEQQQQQRRQSLKMTFQKGRSRAHGTGNSDRSQQDREGHGEDSYYTIQNETEESHDHMAGVTSKKDEKEEILIPEKASSFKFHPGRLCEDQCFYCSGKFGLYDTPCHVGQIKSMERQQKILANEEKLTVDNCLCDACFRHVDRRANVPSYKKRLSAPGNLESLASTSSKSTENQQYDDQNNAETEGGDGFTANTTSRKCLVPDCVHPAAHSLRRKCIRKSVKKFLLKFEIPAGAASVWLCQSHYDTVIQCSGCVLCKRRLGKNHMYHITSDTDRLEKALCEMGIPVQLGIGTAVCKLCRYFANLLMKPPDSTKSQKAEFVKNYRKRLLQFHNIHDGSNDASEADEDSNSNSASNHDNNELQQKTDSLPQNESETSANPKDAAETSEEQLAEKSNMNANNALEESTTTNTLQHDFETAGMSSDSSNSSSASNTATNSPSEMSKLKAILQSNASAEKQPSADISNVLRANPNISMRELFPGEEDLGLHFKAPFGGNSSQRTPEGWTRVQTFLQYDEPTRRLWEELQKPYGNQSSFLRHLILLEKYFRNGDLVLSASASNNASVYTQTVRQRLTSYDKGHCGGLHMGTGTPKENATSGSSNTTKAKEIDPQIPTFVINEDDDEEDSEDQDVEMTEVDKSSKSSSSMPKDSSNATNQNKHQLQRSRSLSVDKLTKQLSSNAVTITARPKDPASLANSKRATPSPQKSLLKDNLMAAPANTSSSSTSANLAAANAAAAVALAASTASASAGCPSNSRSILKCNLLGINKSVEILPINSAPTATITKSSSNPNAPPPPPPPPAPIPPVPETKQQKILDVANKLLGNHLEAAAANQNKNQASLLSSPPELVSLQRRSTGQVMPVATPTNNNQLSGNLVKRPQLLAKPGTSRPPPNVVILPDTLTPQERLQSKTWRPTLMPVEENQNLLNKNGPLYQTADGRRLPALVQVQSGGKPFLISIFDYNRMCILRREKLMRDQMLKATKKRQEAKQQQQQQQAQAHQQQHQHQQQQQQQHLQNQQQQQQQQFQKTNLQNINKNYQTSSAAVNQRQQQVAQQQLLQLQLLQHQQALFKAAAAANNSTNSQNPPRYQTIAPKPATSNITTMPPLQAPINTNANFTTPMMPLLANAITNAANTGNVNPASSSSLNNTSWLWNNFPDANQLLLNGGATPGGANVPKLPQLLAKPNNPATTLTNANNAMKQQQQQQQQQQQHQQQQYLLSKIPKSLTVIPQHKLMHNNAAAGAAIGNTGGNMMKE